MPVAARGLLAAVAAVAAAVAVVVVAADGVPAGAGELPRCFLAASGTGLRSGLRLPLPLWPSVLGAGERRCCWGCCAAALGSVAGAGDLSRMPWPAGRGTQRVVRVTGLHCVYSSSDFLDLTVTARNLAGWKHWHTLAALRMANRQAQPQAQRKGQHRRGSVHQLAQLAQLAQQQRSQPSSSPDNPPSCSCSAKASRSMSSSSSAAPPAAAAAAAASSSSFATAAASTCAATSSSFLAAASSSSSSSLLSSSASGLGGQGGAGVSGRCGRG